MSKATEAAEALAQRLKDKVDGPEKKSSSVSKLLLGKLLKAKVKKKKGKADA